MFVKIYRILKKNIIFQKNLTKNLDYLLQVRYNNTDNLCNMG